jgi:tRNA A-37 threonylcarbamoyl transferase component Bud32
MGAVYEAIDLRLRNSVALKRMTTRGDDADRAFQHEAEMLASLRHSGLPAVIDFFAEREARFLVMQFIEGEDLERHRARRGGVCEPADVLAWAVEILHILEFLHRHQPPIIHRDIKPANVKLTPKGEVVLLDFGLAKGAIDPDATISDAPRSIYGFTRSYAPPEQHEGRGTDARSDLYALGASIYHLLTGVVPAAADVRLAALANGIPDPLRRAHDVNTRLSKTLSAIVTRALAIDPAARFQSAGDMRAALVSLRDVEEETPRGLETRDARRVDAAMPSHAEVGRQIDLLVQVRFVGSPRLGIEDWPGRNVPDQIEQASESVDVDYPRDPVTGRRLAARLRVRIVAPDFTIDGASDCIFEVPPDAYSKRLAFLLTPRRAGLCRVHVEVYAVDALHLGTVPIEAEAVSSDRGRPLWRVAHLMLGMFTLADTASETLALPAPPPMATDLNDEATVPHARVVAPPSARSRRMSRLASIVGPFALLVLVLIVAQQPGLWMPAAPPATQIAPPTSVAPAAVEPAPAAPLPPTDASPVPSPLAATTAAGAPTAKPAGPSPLPKATAPPTPRRAGPPSSRPPAAPSAPASAPPLSRDPVQSRQQQREIALARLRAAQHAAIEEGQKLEAGDDLIGAWKAFERAVKLEATEAKALLQANLERRRAAAQRAYELATTAENYRQLADARRYYEQVLALLPAEDVLHQRAAAALARLPPGL